MKQTEGGVLDLDLGSVVSSNVSHRQPVIINKVYFFFFLFDYNNTLLM